MCALVEVPHLSFVVDCFRLFGNAILKGQHVQEDGEDEDLIRIVGSAGFFRLENGLFREFNSPPVMQMFFAQHLLTYSEEEYKLSLFDMQQNELNVGNFQKTARVKNDECLNFEEVCSFFPVTRNSFAVRYNDGGIFVVDLAQMTIDKYDEFGTIGSSDYEISFSPKTRDIEIKKLSTGEKFKTSYTINNGSMLREVHFYEGMLMIAEYLNWEDRGRDTLCRFYEIVEN